MTIAIEIIIILVGLICFAGGTNILLKGAHGYLPVDIPPQRVLDNLFRFMAGIYFGFGFMLAWVVLHITAVQDLIFFIGIIVACSGLGRWYSRMKVGSAGRYFDIMMIAELLLGVSLIALQLAR